MKSIMFIDDEFEVLEGIRRNLHDKIGEWQMDFVTSAEHALQKMSTDPVNVIVTDLSMTSMQGDQFIDEISDKFPATTPIVLSGNINPFLGSTLFERNIKILSKPCELAVLIEEINQAFGDRENDTVDTQQDDSHNLFRNWDDLENHLVFLTRVLVDNGLVDTDLLASTVLNRLAESEAAVTPADHLLVEQLINTGTDSYSAFDSFTVEASAWKPSEGLDWVKSVDEK